MIECSRRRRRRQKLESDVAFTKIYGMAKKSIIIIDNYVGVCNKIIKQRFPQIKFRYS